MPAAGSSRLPPLARRWVARDAGVAAGAAERLRSELGLSDPLCRLLALRGHTEPDAARRFLKPRLDQLHDAMRMAGMADAVDRIVRAVRAGERILVHGDYDVDGICSVAVLTQSLSRVGARVTPFVPHRMRDGYDLGEAGVRAAAAAGARLIVTADCGTTAYGAIVTARAAGIDVIVTDHHTPGTVLPAAAAVVNPNRADCPYPDKALAGAGVAFKLARAVTAALDGDAAALDWMLDAVAVATIADLAPLRGENRVLVAYGLRVLARTRNAGLAALLRSAGIDTGRPITAGQVGHVLAPRLNAVGRVADAAVGVRLLLAEDEATAAALAARLEAENRTRRAVDRETLAQAMDLLEAGGFDADRDRGVVLAREGWHAGVIGIVASRVVERVHRPTVLLAVDAAAGRARGSARSVPGFHLYEAIRDCGGLLERYGGHRQAAGLDIRTDRIDAFREAFDARARTALGEEDLIPTLNLDLEVRLAETDGGLLRLLRHFGPFGIGNPSPLFIARGVRLGAPVRRVGDGHARLLLRQADARLPAIAFGMADRFTALGDRPFDAAFHLTENHWNGRVRTEARVVDMRDAAGEP
jgi:single-stranded-DNA-specific exonuclease